MIVRLSTWGNLQMALPLEFQKTKIDIVTIEKEMNIGVISFWFLINFKSFECCFTWEPLNTNWKGRKPFLCCNFQIHSRNGIGLSLLLNIFSRLLRHFGGPKRHWIRPQCCCIFVQKLVVLSRTTKTYSRLGTNGIRGFAHSSVVTRASSSLRLENVVLILCRSSSLLNSILL